MASHRKMASLASKKAIPIISSTQNGDTPLIWSMVIPAFFVLSSEELSVFRQTRWPIWRTLAICGGVRCFSLELMVISWVHFPEICRFRISKRILDDFPRFYRISWIPGLNDKALLGIYQGLIGAWEFIRDLLTMLWDQWWFVRFFRISPRICKANTFFF